MHLTICCYRKKPLTAAVFSADGSVLAVAAETAITLWDPDRNELVGVLGDSFSVGRNIFLQTYFCSCISDIKTSFHVYFECLFAANQGFVFRWPVGISSISLCWSELAAFCLEFVTTHNILVLYASSGRFGTSIFSGLDIYLLHLILRKSPLMPFASFISHIHLLLCSCSLRRKFLNFCCSSSPSKIIDRVQGNDTCGERWGNLII